MNKRLIIMLAIALVLFGGIFGFRMFVDHQITQAFDSMEPEAVTISSSLARTERWTPVSEAVGTVRAVDGAELAIEVGGVVREVHFENGQMVEAGQRLITLDQSVDRAELRQLEAAVRLAETELARLEPLARRDSVSQAELDRAENELEQARARVAVQQARIDQKTLTAPFDGAAGIRQVNPGQFIAAGTPVVSLQSLDPIHVEFSVPQRRLPSISVGQAVRVSVDAYPDETFAGEITALEPRLSDSSRSLLVQATLPNDNQQLRPGLFGRVELELGGPEDVVVVPQTAINYATYGNSVYVVTDGEDGKRVSQRFVETGRARGDLVAITDGLEPDEEVATSGLLKLQNDARVEIDDDQATRPSEDPDPRPDNA